MTPGERKLFGCPICGFRLTGREEACPRCGTRFGRGTRFECPFCGEHVDPQSSNCPSCHISYSDFHSRSELKDTDRSIDSLLTEIIAIESAQVKEEDKRLSCPSCSWLLDGNEDRCPKCGAVFSEQVCYQCPICAAMVDSASANCTECGAMFLEAPEEEAVREEVSIGVEEQVEPEAEEAQQFEERPAVDDGPIIIKEELPSEPEVERLPHDEEPAVVTELSLAEEAREEETPAEQEPEATPEPVVAEQEEMPKVVSEKLEESAPTETGEAVAKEPEAEVTPEAEPGGEQPTKKVRRVRTRKVKAKD